MIWCTGWRTVLDSVLYSRTRVENGSAEALCWKQHPSAEQLFITIYCYLLLLLLIYYYLFIIGCHYLLYIKIVED